MHLILLWALVALIGRVECKCSVAPIANDERSIAYVCTHGDLNDLDEISSEADWIEFTVSRIHLIPDNAFWRFKNLKRLSFYNCHINFISPDAFAGLNHLEWLILHGTKIHVARSAWFRPLGNLKRLILDRCGLVHVEADTFRVLPRLEVLGLRDNDLDCLPTEQLSYLRMLRTVRIDGNPWQCECRKKLEAHFRSRSIVQEVECVNACAVIYQCMTPINFPGLPSVLSTEYLYDYNRNRTSIHRNHFQTNVLTSLDRLPDKTTWIEISGLTIETLPRYAFFRFGNSLRSLDLNDCRISTIESGAFAGLHKLQRLSLVGNRFPVLGADWFRDLVSVQQLILRRNQIEEVERTALWHVRDTLRHLDIRDNRLRCIAREELNELKKLERVDVMGNPWYCNCWRDMVHLLGQKIAAFEINARWCLQSENQVPDGSIGWDQQQVTVHNTTTISGTVHWTSFEDSVKETNVSISTQRPSSPPPNIPTTIATPEPPTYSGNCYPDKTNGSTCSSYTCRAITSIEELNVIPKTTCTIRVILSNIKKIPANALDRFNGYIRRLEFQDCGIEKIEPGAFSMLYNLQYLSLRSNQLETIDEEMVRGIHRLRYLDASRNNIYRITNDVFDRLPYLAHLDVSENAMNCIGVEYMGQKLLHLSSLDISNNPWSCLCGTKLADFLDRHGIRYDKKSFLLREDCYASSAPELTTTRPPIPSTTSAPVPNETIEGNCSHVQDTTGIRYRCTGGNLLLLRTIPADATAIEFLDGHLPRLPPDCFLRFVNLREIIIRNSGLATVEHGAFNGLRKLENLTIQDNPLEMIGSSWFAMENLERLDLRGNSIKFIEPGSFRHLNRLTYLNLEGNDLRCIFTSDLNDMPNVYIIEFSGNPLKWRCRVELEQFLEVKKIRFVKIESGCEGKKLMRNLLLQNKTDGSFDCASDCSAAIHIRPESFNLFLLPLTAILIRRAIFN